MKGRNEIVYSLNMEDIQPIAEMAKLTKGCEAILSAIFEAHVETK